MQYKPTIIATIIILSCNACSDREPSKVGSEEHFLKEQKMALDKANEVNKLIQDSAAKMKQDIDRQSE